MFLHHFLQARAHQLLLQNKELLDHMSQLLTKLQDFEVRSSGANIGEITHLTTVLQVGIYLFIAIALYENRLI